MGKATNTQGFSALSGVVIVLAVTAIAGVGYYVWHTNAQTTKPVSKVATATPTNKKASSSATTAPDPYAGWLQYCSPTEKACFKYPANWQAQQIDSSDLNGGAGIKLTSPSGTIVRYQSAVSGIGGGCDQTTDPHIFVIKSVPEPKVPGMYLVETGSGSATIVNHVGLSDNNGKGQPALGDVGDCIYYTVFKSKNDPSQGDGWLETTTTTAFNTTDIPPLELMVESYYYQ